MSEEIAAHFSIMVDPDLDLIRVDMGGFFSEADIEAFRSTLDARMAMLLCGPNEHRMLCDTSAMRIQAQEIVGGFAKIVGHPKYRSKRLAFVVGGSLARGQTRRLTDRDGVEHFGDRASAEAWLLG
jgi:hypothetical protein